MVFGKRTSLMAAIFCILLLPVSGHASVAKTNDGVQKQSVTAVAAKEKLSVTAKEKLSVTAKEMSSVTAKVNRPVSTQAKHSMSEVKVGKDCPPCLKGDRTISGTVLQSPEDVRGELKDKRVKGSGKRSWNPDFILPAGYQEITIMGKADATKNQAAQLISSRNPVLGIGCSIGEIVTLYWEEAEREGIRPDMALAQALVETGYFRFGGDVQAWQHNFCGLGTTGGGVKGAAFKTPREGVRAHIQHLVAYSSHAKPKTALLDPRYDAARRLRTQNGLITKWSGLNWTWAMGGEYAEKIFTAQQKMLQCKDEAPKDMWKDFSFKEKQLEKIYEQKKRYEAKKQRLETEQKLKMEQQLKTGAKTVYVGNTPRAKKEV